MRKSDYDACVADQASSYLIFVHVHPIPEDEDAFRLERALASVAEDMLPDLDVEITAAWVSNFEVISLSDLDALPGQTS